MASVDIEVTDNKLIKLRKKTVFREGVNEHTVKDTILTDTDELLQLVKTNKQKKCVGH